MTAYYDTLPDGADKMDDVGADDLCGCRCLL